MARQDFLQYVVKRSLEAEKTLCFCYDCQGHSERKCFKAHHTTGVNAISHNLDNVKF